MTLDRACAHLQPGSVVAVSVCVYVCVYVCACVHVCACVCVFYPGLGEGPCRCQSPLPRRCRLHHHRHSSTRGENSEAEMTCGLLLLDWASHCIIRTRTNSGFLGIPLYPLASRPNFFPARPRWFLVAARHYCPLSVTRVTTG